MASRRRGKGGRGGKRRLYYWDGIQIARSAVDTALTPIELIGPIQQEFHGGTLVRVRGWISLENAGSAGAGSGATVVLKLMYLEVNDAGNLTGDATPIDTNEEDIAARQLWMYSGRFDKLAIAGDVVQGQQIEVDVKSKVKLAPAGKHILVLLAEANVANVVGITLYLRALVVR